MSILLIPIFISELVYLQSAKVIKNEINQSNSVMLNLVQQDIDSRLSEVENLNWQIAFDPKVAQVLYVKQPLQTYERYTISEIIKDFSRYTSRKFVYSFYVFLKDSQLIISQTAQYDLKPFFELIQKYQGVTFDEFSAMLGDKHKQDFIPLTVKDSKGNNKEVIAYTQSIPYIMNNEVMGNIMILIDEEQIRKVIQNMKWVNTGIVLILNSKNELISSNEPVQLPNNIKYDRLNQSGELLSDQFNGEKVIISYSQSKINDWKYVSIIPVDVFMERVQYVRKLTLIGILLCIVIGGIVAYFFTKKNYHPVNELVQAIAKMAGMSVNKSYNEYRFIREAITNTIAEKEEGNEKIKRQNLMLRSNFLARLLKGRVGDPSAVQGVLSSYGLQFKSEYYAVLLFYIEDYHKFYNDIDQENLKLVQFIIGNVVEDLAGEHHYGIAVEIDELIACLINFNVEITADKNEELTKIGQKAYRFLMDKFNIHLSVSASDVHRTLESIPKTYQEALEALEYRMVFESEKLIKYAEIKRSPNNYNYPLETEYQLINCIKAGDIDGAGDLLNEVFQNNFTSKSLPIQIVKCLLFNLVGTMMKAMDEINGVYEDSFIQELDPVNKLLKCETVADMKEQMMLMLKGISEYILKNRKSYNSSLKTELIEFIEDHFHEVNLSITMIADQFNLHPVYLSRHFKEQTGMGLLDYINRVRVNKAMELLKAQQLNIGDAALRVGYNDTRSLIRMFKKYQGITPSQYKRL